MALNKAFHNLLTLRSFFSFETGFLCVTADLDIFIFVTKGEVLGRGEGWRCVCALYADKAAILGQGWDSDREGL